MGANYLGKPAQWEKMVELVRAAGECGFDTEFWNVDPSKQSCVGKAKVHVWSIAVRTGKQSPRGFTLCRGWCLPLEAMFHPPVKALLEDMSIRKYIHNQSVDQHSLLNHGITLRGGFNTLDYVKWKMPGLINTNGRFKLKALMRSLLGRDPVCSFKDVVSDERIIQVLCKNKKKLKGCSCGAVKCRLRKDSPDGTRHTKTVTLIDAYRDKREEFTHALESIVPGHPRWDLLVRYSIEDSVAALQIAEVAAQAKDPAPWPYYPENGAGPAPGRPVPRTGAYSKARLCGSKPGSLTPVHGAAKGVESSEEVPSGRPEFSQAVVLAIIRMEQVGFPRDRDYCLKQIEVANEDEEVCLNWLYKWYVINSGTFGPHGRRLRTKVTPTGRVTVPSGTDGIWTSGQKKLALFDSLSFPRSPVWAKGKVKEGKSKLDHVAMQWIADNYPPSAQLVAKLLHLGRIRSGRKYLVKLAAADEIVHPICGPAGDEDERSGAVTGRLGIKGELEAQQLPKKGAKDLYGVRRAIVA